MIRQCFFSRKELKDMIEKAPQTRDGYYFFPRFKALVTLKGNIKDDDYYYDRIMFSNKTCFDELDLKMFMARKKVAVDVELKRFIDTKLEDILRGIEFLGLKDIVPDKEYTLEELIDTSIYLLQYKYSQ